VEPRRRGRQPGLRCRRFSHRASARRPAEADLRVPAPQRSGAQAVPVPEGTFAVATGSALLSRVRRTLASSASSSPSRAATILRRMRRRRPARTEVRTVRVAGGGFPSGTPPSLVRRLPPRLPCGLRLGCLRDPCGPVRRGELCRAGSPVSTASGRCRATSSHSAQAIPSSAHDADVARSVCYARATPTRGRPWSVGQGPTGQVMSAMGRSGGF
jgi:hypothetical protein